MLLAECKAKSEGLEEAVDAVVGEDAAPCVTVTVPDGEDSRLTLGRGLKEEDTEEDTESVA